MLKNIFAVIMSFLFISSCSVKKNSFKNRTYHKINTDFNILFNGNEAFKGEIEKLKKGFIEDFTIPIRVEKMPIILKNDTLQIKEDNISTKDALRGISGFMVFDEDEKEKSVSGFEKSIYKANKSIAYHSMKIDGKEYNPSIYKAFETIGKVRFYRGQSSPAMEALQYAKEIAKKERQKEKLDLWIAKTYIQLGNVKKAEAIYTNLKQTKNKKILEQDLLNYIQLDLDLQKYKEAYDLLKYELTLQKNKKTKARLHFLLAQVADILDLKKEALENYQKVRRFKPENQINLKSYTNYIFTKDTIESTEALSLEKKVKRYLNSSNYYEFKDELFYALALLKEKSNDTISARTFYNKSLKEISSDPDNKMRIYKNFAEKFYDLDKYRISKKYYDSAITASRPEKKSVFKDRFQKLSQLDSIYVTYLEKDSIAGLIKMNEPERVTYFEKYIENLKKEEEEKLKKDKINNLLKENNEERELYNITANKEEANNWYFYNTKLLLKGKIEFIQKWGNRVLNDNWRRKNNTSSFKEVETKTTVTIKDTLATTPSDTLSKSKKEIISYNKYEVKYYTQKIPSEEKETVKVFNDRDSIQLKLALAYYTLFKNSKKSVFYLVDLINKKPKDLEIEQKIYFNLYKIYKDLKQETEYNKYKEIILQRFPNSIYAAYVNNPLEFLTNQSSEASEEIYRNAYNLYKENKFLEALALIESNAITFSKDKIAPKAELLKAFILGKLKGKETLIFELKKLQLLFENSDEAKKAKEIINTLK